MLPFKSPLAGPCAPSRARVKRKGRGALTSFLDTELSSRRKQGARLVDLYGKCINARKCGIYMLDLLLPLVRLHCPTKDQSTPSHVNNSSLCMFKIPPLATFALLWRNRPLVPTNSQSRKILLVISVRQITRSPLTGALGGMVCFAAITITNHEQKDSF